LIPPIDNRTPVFTPIARTGSANSNSASQLQHFAAVRKKRSESGRVFREPTPIANLELLSQFHGVDDDVYATIVRRDNAATFGADEERGLEDIVSDGKYDRVDNVVRPRERGLQ
jgi:hypothetical protein